MSPPSSAEVQINSKQRQSNAHITRDLFRTALSTEDPRHSESPCHAHKSIQITPLGEALLECSRADVYGSKEANEYLHLEHCEPLTTHKKNHK